ncbi:MAG: 50S ribosomal protein L29 [Proteobacteria bacterium]|nr:50S ribosomal protein L29 [Pseudomonadota bacterium]
MKAMELREKSQAELSGLLETSRREYFKLRMRQATGQLEKVSEMVKLRKDIARLSTVLRESELRG